MPSRESIADPRRIGFVVAVPCAAWVSHLFLGDLGTAGTVAFIVVGVVAMLVVPLPPWEEVPQRRWVAAIGMLTVCLVVTALATVAHGASGS